MQRGSETIGRIADRGGQIRMRCDACGAERVLQGSDLRILPQTVCADVIFTRVVCAICHDGRIAVSVLTCPLPPPRSGGRGTARRPRP